MKVNLTRHQKGIADARLLMAQEQAMQAGSFLSVYVDKMIKDVINQVKIDASAESKEQYKTLYKSMISSNRGKSEQQILLSCNTRASFDKTRTAFRFCIVEQIKQLRREAEKLSKAKDYKGSQDLTVEAFKLSIKFEDEFLSDKRVLFSDVKSKIGYDKKSLSKRKTAKNAPSSNEVLDNMKPAFFKRHSVCFSVINRFGIRPSEMQKGVKLQFENGRIFAVVRGAKVAKDRGQQVRAIGYEPDLNNAADKLLLEAIENSPNKVFECVQTKKDYNALRKHFNKYHEGFSLYSYRHAFASDLKKSGATRRQIAEAMGHRNTVSQEFYGYSKQGKGDREFVAKASNDIKVKPDIKEYIKSKSDAGSIGSKISQSKKSTGANLQSAPRTSIKPR
ncbi:site-specific integrase [Citrobacter portucalensis]|jgi:integrase|uniref:site-specific integrase n=1 Tax=Citrobacter portucalensis TaxID=1639133 RepID=UPI0018A47AFB|nr:site-specific integrase [Citrobacter portucalensis]BBV53855.1 hypothetical protein STW0522CIT30_P60020 [Citrobacter portucalensis]BBW43684.1 hypothetical protein STN0717CIT72_P40020 [Citrobacter portucalensis]